MTKSYDPEGDAGMGGPHEEFHESETKGNDKADELSRFAIGDLVETAKGAKFWGEITALDADLANPGCTVLAVDPGFAGTKHVYPLKQLRARLSRPSTADAVVAERIAVGEYLRYCASNYPESSDGRNTFVMAASWVEARTAHPSPQGGVEPSLYGEPISFTREARDVDTYIHHSIGETGGPADAVSEAEVEAAAQVIADSPLIDAPKLPAPCWRGLARACLEAAWTARK